MISGSYGTNPGQGALAGSYSRSPSVLADALFVVASAGSVMMGVANVADSMFSRRGL